MSDKTYTEAEVQALLMAKNAPKLVSVIIHGVYSDGRYESQGAFNPNGLQVFIQAEDDMIVESQEDDSEETSKETS